MFYHKKFLSILSSICLENSNSLDQDRSLSYMFLKTVNPKYGWITKAFDGHCSNCAFNVYMFLSGFQLNRTFIDSDPQFIPISNFIASSSYFATTSELQLEDDSPISQYEITNGEGYRKALGYHRLQADYAVYKHCISNQTNCVIISISESHWYTAFFDGYRTWFIDAQTGKGFNLYGHDNQQRMPDTNKARFKLEHDNLYRTGENLTFISFSNKQLTDFLKENPNLASRYYPQMQPIKPNTHNSTKILSFEEYLNRQKQQNPNNANKSIIYRYGRTIDDFNDHDKQIK